MGVSKEGTRQGSHKCGACHSTRGPQLGHICPHSRPGWVTFLPLFSNSPALNLVNPHFLETQIFWWPGNLNLALLGPQSHAPCFVAWDGHYDLLNVNPGYCAQGLSKDTAHIYLEPRLGTACQSWMSTGKGWLQASLGQPTEARGCIH